MKSFYNYILEELLKFRGVYEKYIGNVPFFFRLLCDFMMEDIDKNDRTEISSALAFFVLPNDFIPEDLYGPDGFNDDIFLCTHVIKRLQKKYGTEMLEKHWRGEDDFIEAVETAYTRSKRYLESRGLIYDVLNFLGMD